MITVYGIVYNGYGKFIPQWVDWLKKQTIKPKMIIGLGKDHGADMLWLEKNKIKYIECNSDNMGVIRNATKKHIKTKWELYLSIDDELLPHACEEILNSPDDVDAVSLNFDAIEPTGEVSYNCHSPMINTLDELQNWKKCWGGYVAVKGNHDILYREDIEVPNLTFHFELFKRNLKTVRSSTVCVIHHRWAESHHFRNQHRNFISQIDAVKDEMFKEELFKYNKIKKIKGRGFNSIEDVEEYVSNEKFKKLSQGEQEEFLDWLQKL